MLSCLAPVLALALAPPSSPEPAPPSAPAPETGEASQPTTPSLGMSLSFAFEPRVGSYRDQDATLEDYGYAPVGSPLQLSYGLRGRVFTRGGWILGGAMSYGFRSTRAATTPVPTTTTAFDIAFSGGHQLGLGFFATVDLGFGALTHSVGSSIDGGALVYLGPSLAPRIGYMILTKGPFLALSLGYGLQLPLGPAHAQVLWEAPFERRAVHAGLFAIESGFALGLERWRPGAKRR